MNDRYLFKAKRIDWRELAEKDSWVVGYYVPIKERKYIICEAETCCIDGENTDFYATEWYEIDPSTLCRCTGLKDKAGNLIWENDVVSAHRENGKYEYAIIEYHTSSTMSGFRMNPLEDWVFTAFNEVGVIGNIFDNPELLEV